MRQIRESNYQNNGSNRNGNSSTRKSTELPQILESYPDKYSVDRGYKLTKIRCLDCDTLITINNETLDSLGAVIECPVCAVSANAGTNEVHEDDEHEYDESDEGDLDAQTLAAQVKKLTKLSQQQIEIQESILSVLGQATNWSI